MAASPTDDPTSPSSASSSSAAGARPGGRAADALRPVTIETGVMKHAEGSALVTMGDTKVLVSASVETRIPRWLRDSGRGWVTAEYAMLPRATHTRNRREVHRGRPSGRTSEIQRLIGRSLRAVVDLEALGERSVTVDCDVLQADGGTRTAAITGAWVALHEALAHTLFTGDIEAWPLTAQLAAVSVGIVRGEAALDLEYVEDSAAAVDMNVVATVPAEGGEPGLVEVQGTAEERPFPRAEFDRLLDLALDGIERLGEVQAEVTAETRDEVRALLGRGERRTAPAKDEKDLWGRP